MLTVGTRTLETNSQGRNPRILKEPVERWEELRKSERKRRAQKKRKKKKKEGEALKKRKERIVSLFTARMKEEKNEKEVRKENKRASPCAVGAELQWKDCREGRR